MAGLGMGKELKKAARKTLGNETALRELTGAFVDQWMSALQSPKITETFAKDVAKAARKPQKGSFLLPEGTRFCHTTDQACVFVIEQKPRVRTLFFEPPTEPSPVNPTGRESFRLALPYLIFLPVYVFQNGGTEFSALCVVCRNEPLTSLSNMLCHTNLPNLSSPNLPPVWDEEGDVPLHAKGWHELITCNGISEGGLDFSTGPGDLCQRTNKLLDHFWKSSFTDDLASHYAAMRRHDARMQDLETWEQNSREDPLFVLNVKWFPALRLDTFLSQVTQYYGEQSRVQSLTEQYVGHLVGDAWNNKVMPGLGATRQNLAKYISAKLEETLAIFAKAVAQRMKVINKDTLQRTVLTAVAAAIREATQ